MATELSYLKDTYIFHQTATVVGIQKCVPGTDKLGSQEQDGGWVILLDRTIFYPQGGGQPSDQGVLLSSRGEVVIHHVLFENGEVRHYTLQKEIPLGVGDVVECKIDRDLRLEHAASHTAGHLIAHCAEKINPHLKAVKAYHFLNGPYVEMEGGLDLFKDETEFMELLQDAVTQSIEKKFEIEAVQVEDKTQETSHGQKSFRKVRIGDFNETPCGGTHLNSLAEIARIRIIKLKKAKQNLRVCYQFDRV